MNNNIDTDTQTPPQKEPGILLKVIGILWAIHVLIAALLFPSFLLPSLDSDNPKDIQKEKLYAAFRIFVGTFILFFNIFALIVLFTRSTLIDAAKVLFILMTWILVAFIYILFNHLRDIYLLLTILEDEAIQSRDQSVMLIRAGQTALKAGNMKLRGNRNSEPFSFVDLLKKIGPLALLVMQKGNIKEIAVEALKLAVAGLGLRKYLF